MGTIPFNQGRIPEPTIEAGSNDVRVGARPIDPTPDNQFEILTDGTMITVRYTGGGEEVVKVWKLGMAEMPILAAAMGNESREIAAVTRRAIEWVERLEDDSFEALIEEGRRLNFTRFAKYCKRQADMLKAMGQSAAVDQAVSKALEKVMESAFPSGKSSNS